MALPIAMKTPKVPPVCSMTLPRLVSSSRPRRPYLIPANVPNIAPVLMPTVKPIMAPNLTLWKQLEALDLDCCCWYAGGGAISTRVRKFGGGVKSGH